MSILIICTGESVCKAAGVLNSSEFDAAVQAELSSDILAYSGRKQDPVGRRVLIGEGRLAMSTAEQLLLPCDVTVDSLLNEIPLHSFTDTEKRFSVDIWKRKAAAQRKHADPRQPESRDMVIARAEQFLKKTEGCDTLLITYPLFLVELLDRLRVHNYVVQRTGILKIQPLERFIVSRKEEHCGGCQHNCFLANPGCGIGRDKAMRKQLTERRSN